MGVRSFNFPLHEVVIGQGLLSMVLIVSRPVGLRGQGLVQMLWIDPWMFRPERAEPRINVVNWFEPFGPERAGPRINVVEWSVYCRLEMAGPRINVVEWSVVCGPETAGLRTMHSDPRAHGYKVK